MWRRGHGYILIHFEVCGPSPRTSQRSCTAPLFVTDTLYVTGCVGSCINEGPEWLALLHGLAAEPFLILGHTQCWLPYSLLSKWLRAAYLLVSPCHL